MGEWDDARAAVSRDGATVNLNSGSSGPLPHDVITRVSDLRRHLAEAPMDFLLRRVPPLLWQARCELADFVGSAPHQLMFTTNVTAAVNLVASSLRLAPGSEILMSDQEYDPMRWCWERVAREQDVTVTTFPVPHAPGGPQDLLDAAVAALTPRTRVLFVSHVVSATGIVMPIAELCAAARRQGVITVVDGAHGPAFTDLDLQTVPCDFYVGSGHKWLLAPTGVGFLHLGAGAADLLRPLQVSWASGPLPDGTDLDAPDAFGSTGRLRPFECEGTRDICPWLAVPAALDFHRAHGQARALARMHELADHARERLTGRQGLSPVTPADARMSGGMTTFRMPQGTVASDVRRRLWDGFGIEVGVAQESDRALLRVSTHVFTTEDDIERLARALAQIA